MIEDRRLRGKWLQVALTEGCRKPGSTRVWDKAPGSDFRGCEAPIPQESTRRRGRPMLDMSQPHIARFDFESRRVSSRLSSGRSTRRRRRSSGYRSARCGDRSRWPARARAGCGELAKYFSERPILKSRPLPTSTNGMLSRVCELPLPSSLVHMIVVLSSKLPPPPGFVGVSAEALGQVGKLFAELLVDLDQFFLRRLVSMSSWCESSWCPSVTPSHFMRAPPTELVYCNVATRTEIRARSC